MKPSVWFFRKNKETNYELERFEAACEELEVDLKVVYSSDFDIIITRNDRKSVRYQGENIKLPSIVLAKTGAGTDFYALSVLRHLERLHVPVINSTHAIETVKDKLYTTQILAQAGFPTPKTMLVKFPVDVDVVESQIGIPCIVKVLTGSNGNGVTLIKSKDQLKTLMDFVLDLGETKNIIIQEYIGHKPGEDVRVIVLGNKVIGAMKRKGSAGDFRANISRGGEGEAFPVDQELIELALGSAKLCGLEIGGIDLLFDEDGYKICECNSNPGYFGFDKANNTNFAKTLVEYIKEKVD